MEPLPGVTELSPLRLFWNVVAQFPWLGKNDWQLGREMAIELLIQCLVRQMTVLNRSTCDGRRGSCSLGSGRQSVFLDLVAELNRQGVGRKVSADMFGLGFGRTSGRFNA